MHASDNFSAGGIQSQATNGAGDNVYLATLTIGNPPVTNAALTAGNIGGIDCDDTADATRGIYGINDVSTDTSGDVYFWLSLTSSKSIELAAGGSLYANSSVSVSTGNNSAATLNFIKVLKSLVDMPNALGEISNFYNTNGLFILSSPQTVTIYQGDGKNTHVTLYASDTIFDVAKKINDAIAFGLGQGVYTDNASNFCTIADGTLNTSESVATREPVYDDKGNIIGYKTYATMLIRSALPGAVGELTFTGSEELLQALGLNTIQQSRESEFSVTIYDAHSGKLVNPTQTVSGNVIYGAITGNVDVKFDPLANINISWNEKTKRYNFTNATGTYTTFVHLADNSTILQIGANEGEDFTVLFAEITSYSLGLDGLLTVSREAAARAITIIDNAIDKVSTQRATLGAYQNRLEHTVTNLTTASTNTTAAESRIRDADMSKEMLNFTLLQILMQSGTAMLTQANQLPQSVIGLIRG
ncbi:hypothetical protein AGMMS50276_26690 [Synergistales bacterium]|nr:hypothetical protein AGMMS50276_26690 [Synergistales bacterium]